MVQKLDSIDGHHGPAQRRAAVGEQKVKADALRGFPVSAVAALAGRRIDAPDAKEARFPPANVARVRERIAAALREHDVVALVASAACGADLIALDEAAKLGIRRRIVLPFRASRSARNP